MKNSELFWLNRRIYMAHNVYGPDLKVYILIKFLIKLGFYKFRFGPSKYDRTPNGCFDMTPRKWHPIYVIMLLLTYFLLPFSYIFHLASNIGSLILCLLGSIAAIIVSPITTFKDVKLRRNMWVKSCRRIWYRDIHTKKENTNEK